MEYRLHREKSKDKTIPMTIDFAQPWGKAKEFQMDPYLLFLCSTAASSPITLLYCSYHSTKTITVNPRLSRELRSKNNPQ